MNKKQLREVIRLELAKALDSKLNEGPIDAIKTALYTKKVMNQLPSNERSTFLGLLVDPEFQKMMEKQKLSGSGYALPSEMERYISYRVDDHVLRRKIINILTHKNFDAFRQGILTQLVTKKDDTARPLDVTHWGRGRQATDKEYDKKIDSYTNWLKSAQVKNPKTGKMIRIYYVLTDPQHPAYEEALKIANSKRVNLKLAPLQKPNPKSSTKMAGNKISWTDIIGHGGGSGRRSSGYSGGGGGKSSSSSFKGFGGGGGFSGGGAGGRF